MKTITLLEPYFTGSHARWARGLARQSRHKIQLLRLPGRFWKWRMHGGAVTLARMFLEEDVEPDLIVATDMLDLTTYLALTRQRTANVPAAVYFHENQLTYPAPPGSRRDLHYGFINYASAHAADYVFFNSAFHRDAFLDELPRLLKHFPDYNELQTIDEIADKSEVLPLGMNLKRLDRVKPEVRRDGPLRILWNHRWEYDKQPEVFFEALYALQAAAVPFQVIVTGESFRQRPDEFLEARSRLAEHILFFGYAENFETYARLLWDADVQVSCAIQDFFGGSTCEAIYGDCYPILPDRLNYRTFIPADQRERHLYHEFGGLVGRLRWAAENLRTVRETSLREAVSGFDWSQLIGRYDETLEGLTGG